MVALTAPVDCVPLTALVPLQPPEPLHVVALVALQISVDEPPVASTGWIRAERDGWSGRGRSGDGDRHALIRATAATRARECKLVVAVRGPVDRVPLVACGPLHPPEAVQLLAFVELQFRVDTLPLATLVGFAPSDTVGGGP